MLELLKGAAKSSQRTNSEALPPDELMFELVYPSPPDLKKERAHIERLLGGGGFDLFHYSKTSDSEILILKFSGVDRQQSPEFLFQTSAELKDALGLDAVTPEIDAMWNDAETSAPGTEGVGEAIWKLCLSEAPTPVSPDWARKSVRAEKAFDAFGVDGTGILVGQPDTGVARHREINGALRLDLGYNFVDDQSDPTDPLSIDMGSPGHGTATSSCVISRDDHVITGTAPGAFVVPIRCVNRVVIGTGFAVAKAVDHARNVGCHIITMSLGGGVVSFSLKRAIRRATEAGLIVMCAAGNCVKFVVFPAWDAKTIAVAGVDENDQPWKGSSRGDAVDISAPGENVHVARRPSIPTGSTPPPDHLSKIDERGQGTSYAVATTAGCAALWLQKHGVDAVHAEAKKRKVQVQELFRAALVQTARKPKKWDASNMGAGIVDAFELCSLALSDIGSTKEKPDSHPSLFAFGKTVESASLESEAGHVAMDWLIRQSPNRAAGLESASAAKPTKALAKFIGRTEPEPPKRPAGEKSIPETVVITAPATPPLQPMDALRTIASSLHPKLGRVDKLSIAKAIESIKPLDLDHIKDQMKATIEDPAAPPLNTLEREAFEKAIVDLDGTLPAIARASGADAESVLLNLSVGPETEAVVMLTGRPVIPTGLNGLKDWAGSGDDEILSGPRAGNWAADLVPRRAAWRAKVNAVGRIDRETTKGWRHEGTGFLVAPGMVMTNRHVVQNFAEPIPEPGGRMRFELQTNASIIFDSEGKNEQTRFKIKRVIGSGGTRIGMTADIAALDMALLEIDTHNGHGEHPEPIGLAAESSANTDRSFVLVAGYPAKPSFNAVPADQSLRLQYWDRLQELFGGKYGVKYIAPGQITRRPGRLAGDIHKWTFAHDATTLGGNSGSCILTLDDDLQLCGLHFGGSTLTMNFAHDIKQAILTGDSQFSLASLNIG